MSIPHSQALELFIANLKEKKRSPSTIIAYKKDIEQLFGRYKNEISLLSDYKTNHLELYIQELVTEQKFTLKTISRKINSFRTLFKFLHSENHVNANIAEGIVHPKFETKQRRILNSLEYKALRDTARSSPRLYAMVEVLLQTGMRIGELSRLKISQLELDAKVPTATIESYASNPARTIILNETCVEAIRKYLKIRPRPQDDEGYLFTTKSGKQVLIRNIRTTINNTFKKSGIDDATVNDIRNTFIVFQLEHGVPLEQIAEIVGHKRITSTEKYLEMVKTKRNLNSSKTASL